MIQYADQINRTVKGLGAIIENQSPVIKFLAKNWFITGIAGLALTGQMVKRYKDKTLSPVNVLTDLGLVLGPTMSYLSLQEMARNFEAQRKINQAELAAAREAQTTIRPLSVTAPSLPVHQ